MYNGVTQLLVGMATAFAGFRAPGSMQFHRRERQFQHGCPVNFAG
jgi:hypothetical protein